MAEGSASLTPNAHRGRSQLIVMVGLLVTFGGLAGYALQIPTNAAALVSIAPWLAVGFLTTWSGGILVGNARVAPPEGVSPILRGQYALGGVGTVAGSLSSVVVIERLGPWTRLSAMAPPELAVAIIAATLVWMGGLLMGVSMRRFVRRRRRPTPAT